MEDLTGQRFSFLTVTSYYGKKWGVNMWTCICDCGKTTIAQGPKLKSGKRKSCGCYNDKLRKEFAKNHTQYSKYNVPKGFSKHPIYNSFNHMINRCYNKKDTGYSLYGGRGISVCDEWLNNPQSFLDWSLTHGWKKGLSIDRIDVNGNYEPSNCRWTTNKVQSNNKRNNVYITFNDQTRTVTQWAEYLNINKRTLNNRINRGWSIEKALTVSVKTKGGSK